MTYETTIKALSDPTRRGLLELVARHPLSVGELAERLPISQPAVSQHLKVLREANLVSVRKEGATRVYSLRREGLDALRTYLESFWEGVLGSFADGIELK